MSMNDEPRMLIRLTSFDTSGLETSMKLILFVGGQSNAHSPIVSDPYLILCYQ